MIGTYYNIGWFYYIIGKYYIIRSLLRYWFKIYSWFISRYSSIFSMYFIKLSGSITLSEVYYIIS